MGTNSILRAPPSGPNYVLKAPFPNSNTLGITASAYELWEDTNIQAIAFHSAPSHPNHVFLACHILPFQQSSKSQLIPTSPLKSKVLSNYYLIISENWGRYTSSWSNFLFNCETVKPNKLSASKIQQWDRHRRDFLKGSRTCHPEIRLLKFRSHTTPNYANLVYWLFWSISTWKIAKNFKIEKKFTLLSLLSAWRQTLRKGTQLLQIFSLGALSTRGDDSS